MTQDEWHKNIIPKIKLNEERELLMSEIKLNEVGELLMSEEHVAFMAKFDCI